MEEVRLGDGPIEVSVLPEVGARLHRLRAYGHDLLRTPGDAAVHADDPLFWGAYVMAPWCNRLQAAPTRVGGRTVALDANFPDGSAIHGQVYARPWKRRGDFLSVMGGDDGWPWAYALEMRVDVTASLVRLSLTLKNRSTEPMPAGVGLHPWWRSPGMLAVPGSRVYPRNPVPDGEARPAEGELDLHVLAPPPAGLDATWTDIAGSSVILSWPDLGLQATLVMSASLSHVAVATPAGVDAIAVEPQSHAPFGLDRLLRRGDGGMFLLPPGETLAATLDIRIVRDRDG
jgi:aldose 1-epimerase